MEALTATVKDKDITNNHNNEKENGLFSCLILVASTENPNLPLEDYYKE